MLNVLNRYVPVLMSLLPTPLLLFVSSASDIYLRNASLLQYQYQVLAPFAKLSLLTLVVGILFSALSSYHRSFRFALWVYYLTGPLFLLFAFFRGLGDALPGVSPLYGTTTGLAFWPLLLLVAAVVVGRHRPSLQVIRAFATFGIVLLAYEGGILLHHVLSHRHPASSRLEITGQPPSNMQSSPNIYHLIFDAYQTNLLEHTLSDESEAGLGGFTYFPNNKAESAVTRLSMTTFFSGRDYFYDRSKDDYINDALTTEASFLYWLKSQGYQTLAYIPSGWSGRETFFDRVVRLYDAASDDILPLNAEALWNLWLYSNTPAALRDTVVQSNWFAGLNENDMELLQSGRLLPTSVPVASYLTFQKMVLLSFRGI